MPLVPIGIDGDSRVFDIRCLTQFVWKAREEGARRSSIKCETNAK